MATKVKDIIQDLHFILNEEQGVFGEVKTPILYRHVKAFMEKLSNDSSNELFVRVLEAYPEGLELPFPEDAIDIVSVSMSFCLSGNRGQTLLPLYENSKMNISSSFIRDNSGLILKDNDDEFLRGVGSTVGGNNCAIQNNNNTPYFFADGYYNGYNSTLENGIPAVQGGVMSVTPQIRINREDKVIQFSSNMDEQRPVIVEYIYDINNKGNVSNFDELEVHAFYREACIRFVQRELANTRMNVSGEMRSRYDARFIQEWRSANTKLKSIKNPKQALNKRYKFID